MKTEIVRALEEGTWAELRVRDWDLRGAAQRWHRFCALVCSRPYRLTGIAIDGPAWKGLLAAMNAGVPTGLRLGGTSAHEAIRSARLRVHDLACALRLDSMNGLPRLGAWLCGVVCSHSALRVWEL
jgi:hypothetical protein